MTERLTCSNCGAPVTRQGTETRVTCTHCQNVTEFAPIASDDEDDDDYEHDHGRGGNHVPQIVIIQGGGPSVVRHESPVIIERPSFLPFILYPLIFIALSGGVGGYVHHRASKVSSAITGAENAVAAAEKAQKEAADRAAAAQKEAAERTAAAQKEAAAEKAAAEKTTTEKATTEKTTTERTVPGRATERAPQRAPEKKGPAHH